MNAMGKFFVTYSVASILLTIGVVSYAWQTRIQFYPTVIFLCTSKFSVAVLCNLAICLTMITFKTVTSIFLGKLRDAEYEVLSENARYAFTETCLALTYFRDELNLKVAGLFVALLVSKIFHWLCKERITYMESTQNTPFSKHIRLISLKLLLLSVDTAFVSVALHSIQTHGPSVWLLFGFEFLCLVVNIYAIFMRYILHLADLMTPGGWMNKETYVFYLELTAEVARVFVYVAFFFILFTYYGIPLHIFRDLYMSVKNLIRRINEFCQARNITSRMDELFPDATEEELADRPICIICREDMTFGQRVKKLQCGHLFHFQCLRTWLERQQSCPTCRQAIVVRRGATPDGQVRVGQQANGQGNDGNANNAAEEDANVNAPGNREVDARRDNEDGGNQNSAEPAGEAQPNTLPVRTSVNPVVASNRGGNAQISASPDQNRTPTERVDPPSESHGGPQPFQGNQTSPFLGNMPMLAPPPGMPMPPFMPSPTAAGNPPPEMPPGMMPPFPGMPMPPMPNGLMQPPGAFPSPQQFPPSQNMFGMYGMMPPPFSPQFPGMNMNIGSPQFPGTATQGSPAQPNIGENSSSPALRRSQSTPTRATRASKLQAIQRQIEMLEAHLKEISPGKKSTLKRAQSNPVNSSRNTQSTDVVVGDDEVKADDVEPSVTVPEINLDEQQRDGDETPQALRRRKAAAAALRRLSSKEQ